MNNILARITRKADDRACTVAQYMARVVVPADDYAAFESHAIYLEERITECREIIANSPDPTEVELYETLPLNRYDLDAVLLRQQIVRLTPP